MYTHKIHLHSQWIEMNSSQKKAEDEKNSESKFAVMQMKSIILSKSEWNNLDLCRPRSPSFYFRTFFLPVLFWFIQKVTDNFAVLPDDLECYLFYFFLWIYLKCGCTLHTSFIIWSPSRVMNFFIFSLILKFVSSVKLKMKIFELPWSHSCTVVNAIACCPVFFMANVTLYKYIGDDGKDVVPNGEMMGGGHKSGIKGNVHTNEFQTEERDKRYFYLKKAATLLLTVSHYTPTHTYKREEKR